MSLSPECKVLPHVLISEVHSDHRPGLVGHLPDGRLLGVRRALEAGRHVAGGDFHLTTRSGAPGKTETTIDAQIVTSLHWTGTVNMNL